MLLERVVEGVLRAKLAAEAPELQDKAQHATLAGVGQCLRQAMEKMPRAQLSKGEPNRGLQ